MDHLCKVVKLMYDSMTNPLIQLIAASDERLLQQANCRHGV